MRKKYCYCLCCHKLKFLCPHDNTSCLSAPLYYGDTRHHSNSYSSFHVSSLGNKINKIKKLLVLKLRTSKKTKLCFLDLLHCKQDMGAARPPTCGV